MRSKYNCLFVSLTYVQVLLLNYTIVAEHTHMACHKFFNHFKGSNLFTISIYSYPNLFILSYYYFFTSNYLFPPYFQFVIDSFHLLCFSGSTCLEIN